MVKGFAQNQPTLRTKMCDSCILEVGIYWWYINTYFSNGKSRLAPAKTVALPRLDLNAAVIAKRIAQVINKEMSYHSIPWHIVQIQHWRYIILRAKLIDLTCMLQIELLKFRIIVKQVIGNTLMGKWIQLICVPEDLWIQPISYRKINMVSHGDLARIFYQKNTKQTT